MNFFLDLLHTLFYLLHHFNSYTFNRYVTLRRQRPQSTRDSEDSENNADEVNNVNLQGRETEVTEEIKSFERTSTLGVVTTIKPKIKVSLRPTTITSTTTDIPTVPYTSTTEIPTLITVDKTETVNSLLKENFNKSHTAATAEIPTIYTLTTESETEFMTEPTTITTELGILTDRTIPYQTSTITRVGRNNSNSNEKKKQKAVKKMQLALKW